MQLAHREDRFRMLRSILVKFLFPREISHIVESIKKIRKQHHKDYMEERLISKIIYIFPLNDNE